MKVAVSGSSGFLGKALVTALQKGGHSVLRLVRREPQELDEVEWRPASGLPNPAPLEALDSMIHLAGASLDAGRWNEERKRRIRDSRVLGTRQLVASLLDLERPPTSLLTASALGIYGDAGENLLTEQSNPGTGFLAETCIAWEAAAAAPEDMRTVQLRLGVVLHEEGGMLARLLPIFRSGAGARLGNGNQWMSWISLADAVGSILHLLQGSDTRGPVILATPEPVPHGEFVQLLAEKVGHKARIQLPSALVTTVFGEMGRELILASTRAHPVGLIASGYQFQHPDLQSCLQAGIS